MAAPPTPPTPTALSTLGDEIVLGSHARPAFGVAFSADSKLLASTGADGTIKLWDVPARRSCARCAAGW